MRLMLYSERFDSGSRLPGRNILGPALFALLVGCAGPEPQAPVPTDEPDPVVGASDPFVDVTADVGLDFVHVNGMSGGYYYSEMMGSGAALFDADNDGDLDLYLVQGTGLDQPVEPVPSDRLFLNEPAEGEPGFRFVDRTEGSGIPGGGYGMGVVAADFDDDGWTDLYITQTAANRLLRHKGLDEQGRPTFENVADEVTGSRRWGVPAVPFDADGDGDTDLFVGNYVAYSIATNKRCTDELGQANYCGPLAYPPVADQLLINVTEDGPLRFEDRSGLAGIERDYGACLGAAAADFNDDGLLDLYVANDGQPNQLWINLGGGRFENQALLAGAGVNGQGFSEASMGVSVVDADGDLDEDVFLTHLSRETHTLYVNDGHGGFLDRSTESGLGGPSLDRTGFGTALFDYNHDGLLDAVVATGAVKVIKELALAGDPHPLHQRNQLYRGIAAGRFEDVTDAAGTAFALSEVSRSAVLGDLDNDGDLDVVLTNNAGPARVLLNRVGQDRPWLGLRLLSASGSDVPAAAVRVTFSDGRRASARVGANAGYASSGDPRVSIPLGPSPSAEVEVVVRWPDGVSERWNPTPDGTYIPLRRGTGDSTSSEP